MKKFVLPLLLVSSLSSAFNVACGPVENSEVKYVDPATAAAAAKALYGAYKEYEADRTQVARLNKLKDLMRQQTAQIIATVRLVQVESLTSQTESFVFMFDNMANWTDTDYALATQRINDLFFSLKNIVIGPSPESSVAAAKALVLVTPMAAIVNTLRGFDNINQGILNESFNAFAVLLTKQYPQYLRNQKPVTNPEIYITKYFTMGKGWMWEGQIAAMFQIIAPMEAEFLAFEEAQKSIAEMLSIAPTPRSYLQGVHKIASGWMGYFSGGPAFCGYESPQHLSFAGTTVKQIQENGFSIKEAYLSTPGMRNDGSCKTPIPTGFFKQNGNDAIFWSNGVNAYCYVPQMKYVTGPVLNIDFNVHNATSLRRDGNCPGQS